MFNFQINHIKGSENNTMDTLSRRANYIIDIQQSSRAMLVQNKDGLLEPNRAELYIIAMIAIEVKELT